jgi:signal transduction histidine kinase
MGALMSLAVFIQENTPQIISEWESFARSLIPASNDMTPLALRNHIKQILVFIVKDMESPQTGPEQIQKSHGEGAQKNKIGPSAAETHAALRMAGGFNMDQMVSEYRALRASIIKLWSVEQKEVSIADIQDLTRFNETIDQALTESISHYAGKLADSKDMFLGILTHDLRNPLTTILMSTQLIPQIGPLNERQGVLVEQVIDSSARIDEIVSHLLDITRARFGSGLPVLRAPMDIGFVGRQLVDEARIAHPDRKFILDISGETEGEWDKARIGQVFSNLLGNAAQYSFKDTPIKIIIKGTPNEVALSVHNEGLPIPANKIAGIFDSLVRVTAEDKENNKEQTTNLGLGLFITREIVMAHGGVLEVTSSEKGGTTFTAHFPKRSDAETVTVFKTANGSAARSEGGTYAR